MVTATLAVLTLTFRAALLAVLMPLLIGLSAAPAFGDMFVLARSAGVPPAGHPAAEAA